VCTVRVAASVRLAGGACACRRLDKARGILDALQVQAERRHPLIGAHELEQVLGRETRLIAHGERAANGQRAVVVQQVERQRAALADQGDAAFAPLAHHLIGPQCRAIEEVDEAVAIGAEERQFSGADEQLPRQTVALVGGGFGKAGREAHEAAGATARERRGNGRHLAVGRCDEGGVWCRRQLVDGAEVALRVRGGTGGMNAPHLARVADHAARGERRVSPGAADEGEAAWREQALQRARAHGARL
jgi:hypothetical protein